MFSYAHQFAITSIAINSIFQRKNFKAITSLYSKRMLDVGVRGSSCENPSRAEVGGTSQRGGRFDAGPRPSSPQTDGEGLLPREHPAKSQIQLGAGVPPAGAMRRGMTSLRTAASAPARLRETCLSTRAPCPVTLLSPCPFGAGSHACFREMLGRASASRLRSALAFRGREAGTCGARAAEESRPGKRPGVTQPCLLASRFTKFERK